MAEGSCIIVGAGISGLLAARELDAGGRRVTVLEKGPQPGGRMATRRMGDAACDYGAQFFTVRDDRFRAIVEGWISAGAAVEWSRGFADARGAHDPDGHPRYRGEPGMSSIPGLIARDLDVRTGERAVRIGRDDGGWTVSCESGLSLSGEALVLTAPVPQSLALVASGEPVLGDEARTRLARISYGPCLALMAVLDGPSPVPEPGGVQIKSEPLDWIGDNSKKGISHRPALTIHAGPEWSREHFDDGRVGTIQRLLDLAGRQLDTDLSGHVVESSLARWRYSWVTTPHDEPCLVASEDPPLVFCGDAFGNPKIEGAALSGLQAADRLLGLGE